MNRSFLNKLKKINKKNLILSAAFGYKWNDLKIFIKSLRKFSNCRTLLIVDKKIDCETEQKLKSYKIEIYKYLKKDSNLPGLQNNRSDIGQRRYGMYEYILKKINKKPKNICLTDSRDVVFQEDIFKINYKKKINFFLEEEKILNDNRNKRWLIRTVGSNKYEKIKDNYISCSGTTIGDYKEILKYSNLMKKNLNKYLYKLPLRHQLLLRNIEPYDQGLHNYLIYNNYFKDKKLHKNKISKICTTAFMKKFKFNKKKQLINEKGKIYSLIHQYDRAKNKLGKPIFKFDKIYE